MRPAGGPTVQPVAALPSPGARLRGPWLALARTAWAAAALMCLAIVAADLPITLAELRASCAAEPCATVFNVAGERTLQQMGLSLDFVAVYVMALLGIASAGFFAVAILVFWRKSADWLGLFVSLWLVVWGAEISSQFRDELVAAQPVWRWPVALSLAYVNAGVLLFPYVFPNGQFVPGWLRWLALVFTPLFALANVFPGTPLDVGSWPRALGILLLASMFGSGVFAQIYRYYRVSNPVERQQTKWVVAGFAGMIAIQFAHFAVFLQTIHPTLDQSRPVGVLLVLADFTIATLALLLLPITVGISIVRYRLWDIDLLIRRTLIYSTLTATLALVYFSSVVFLQAVVRALTGGGQSQLAVVGSTLAIAALFAPLRRRVQDFIDRRFFRRKYDAAQTLTAFAEAARDETDLDALAGRLVGVVEETMQPAHASLWLRPGLGAAAAHHDNRGKP